MVMLMKKIHFVVLLAVALVFIQGGGSVLYADDEVVISEPHDAIFSRYRPNFKTHISELKGESRYWSDVNLPTSSYLLKSFMRQGGEGNKLCSSLSDPNCNPVAGSYMSFLSILGSCESDSELSCVEGISFSTNSLQKENLRMISGGTTLQSELRTLGVPRGTYMSIWQASDGSRFAVMPKLSADLSQDSNGWMPASSSSTRFTVNIKRVRSYYVAEIPKIRLDEVNGGLISDAGWPQTLEFAPQSRFELRVRLPNTTSSWFHGRIANAFVGATAIDAERTLYTFAGDPAKVQVAGAFASADSADFPAPREAGNTSHFRQTVGRASSIEDYAKWKSFMNDTALMTRSEWSVEAFKDYSTAGKSCLSGSTGAVGIAATNAAFYSPIPPTINPTTGFFEYEVASPHFDDSSKVAVGTYTFGAPVSVVQCLYGSEVVPNVARVVLSYDDGGSPYSVTQDVSVKDGWVNVSVSGFHFSKPKFKVSFMWRDAKGRVVALPSAVKKGQVRVGSRFAPTVLANPSSRFKPKWSVVGACRLRTGTVITTKRGTCIVSLKVLNSSNRYITKVKKSIRVV